MKDARARVKKALGWDGEVIFTSGASEAARIAVDQADVMHEAVSAVEHDALHGFVEERGAGEIAVDSNGAVDHSAIAGACAPSSIAGDAIENRSLIAIQHVNSETGTLQDVAAAVELVHEYSGLLVADCAQSAGKLELPSGADMLIVSAHKFGGPIGVGALLVRNYAMLKPTGGHERGYRRGTENLPAVLGMAAALEAGEWATNVAQRARFADDLGDARLVIGRQADHILPLVHPKLSAQGQVIRLDAMGFAVSAGSACSSGTLKKSRVLDAFGVDDDTASRTIRVSLGWNTAPADLDRFAEAWTSLK